MRRILTPRRKANMTVCIAAICTWDAKARELMIVGASDRMLSGQSLKYEPDQRKVYEFSKDISPRAIALAAGDPYAQISICNRVSSFYRKLQRPAASIEEIALKYADALIGYKRDEAETLFLKTHSLSVTEFIDRMTELPADFVADIRHKLDSHSVSVETIIAGIDDTGPHLFTIDHRGVVLCADAVSFACIGSGAEHAQSQFMVAKYQRMFPHTSALTLTYIAKKRSEGSPTVGTATDLFFIGRDGYSGFSDLIHEHMETVFEKYEADIGLAIAGAVRTTRSFISEVLAKHQASETGAAPIVEPQPDQRKPHKTGRKRPTAT